ncbi:MAG: DUF4384 domain-containing protein [Spirochaetales bacterium]|jgi:hypothetical protein|nr:DUF4384 domain-containing protein [Spirochaetales bacterium]
MKKLFLIRAAGLVILLLLSGAVLFSQEQSVTWTMALVREEDGGGVRSFSRPLSMKDGERFTLMISAEESCHCYIVLQDAAQNTVLVYSGTAGPGKDLSFGPFRIDPPSGTETIHVVVSKTSRPTIDRAAENYTRSKTRRNASALMDSIYELRRSLSSLREQAEKPVLMGGAFRGREQPPAGVQYAGAPAYVKSIQIRH